MTRWTTIAVAAVAIALVVAAFAATNLRSDGTLALAQRIGVPDGTQTIEEAVVTRELEGTAPEIAVARFRTDLAVRVWIDRLAARCREAGIDGVLAPSDPSEGVVCRSRDGTDSVGVRESCSDADGCSIVVSYATL